MYESYLEEQKAIYERTLESLWESSAWQRWDHLLDSLVRPLERVTTTRQCFLELQRANHPHSYQTVEGFVSVFHVASEDPATFRKSYVRWCGEGTSLISGRWTRRRTLSVGRRAPWIRPGEHTECISDSLKVSASIQHRHTTIPRLTLFQTIPVPHRQSASHLLPSVIQTWGVTGRSAFRV